MSASTQAPAPPPVRRAFFSDLSYTVLKHTAAVVLPAAGALYFALAQIWHLPHAADVVGSIAALNTFIGGAVVVSSASYNNSNAKYDGAIVKTEDESGKTTYSLNLNTAVEDLDKMKDVLFRVVGN